MNLPNFLIIGAMKCGSTTLYHDLVSNPEIFIPEKESNFLTSFAAKDTDALAKYASMFQKAHPQQCCGEVSTEYSMLPDQSGIAERACSLLGNDLKIIYLVREPVSRAISHHYHMHSWHGPGKMGSDINRCVKEYTSIINYGRYYMQLQPWRAVFGDHSISVVVFEEYIKNRTVTINNLCQFLGVGELSQPIDASAIYNSSENKRVLNKSLARIRESKFYLQTLRKRIPASLKTQMKKLLCPTAPTRPAPPSLDTVKSILEQTSEDTNALTAFLSRESPIWEPYQVLSNYSQSRDPETDSRIQTTHKAA